MKREIRQTGQSMFRFIRSFAGKKHDNNNNNLQEKYQRQMLGFRDEYHEQQKQHEQTKHPQHSEQEQKTYVDVQTAFEQQKQYEQTTDEQEQEAHEQHKQKGTGSAKTEKKQKKKLHLKLFFKCLKKSMSTKRNRQIFLYESYCYLWDWLFTQ